MTSILRASIPRTPYGIGALARHPLGRCVDSISAELAQNWRISAKETA